MHVDLSELEKQIQSGRSVTVSKALARLEKLLRKDERTELFVLRANALKVLQRHREAADAYALAAEKGGPYAGQCWLRAGLLYSESVEQRLAIAAYQHALECTPDSLDARNNLAITMYQTSQGMEALPHARWLMEHSPHAEHYITAFYVFRAAMLLDDALKACKKALHTAPDNWTVIAANMQASQHAADWEGVEQLERRYMEAYSQGLFAQTSEMPLVNVTWCMDERINCKVAQNAARALQARPVTPCCHVGRPVNPRPRIGYVSADLRNHAIMHLTAGLFEQHDREKFEIFVYSHSPNDGSPYRQRLLEALGDHHIDTRALSEAELAKRVKEDNIDILVDLMGLTEKNRLPMFRLRPAPILCTWLGFPGTTGYDFLDYAITDPVVTPDSSKPFFTEKLCRLPETYQSNDFRRVAAANAMTRAQFGLPDDALVLASFNQTGKIDKQTFSIWMRLLRDIPRALLWVLDPGATARGFMLDRAQQEGVDPLRIVFAKRTPPPLHLARLPLADMVVDTRVYNGHTTTSDALWTGVPVFTVPGQHFASRVSASLLKACGMEECIATDWEDFHRTILRFAGDATLLASLRAKLARNRFIYPLYDSERFARHLERAYTMMLERYGAGLPPEHLDVPVLPPRETPFTTGILTRNVAEQSPEPDKSTTTKPDRPLWRLPHAVCPLCRHEDSLSLRPRAWSLDGDATAVGHWRICQGCDHVFTYQYWTPPGREEAVRRFGLPDISAADDPFAARSRAGEILRAAGRFIKKGSGKAITWAEIYPPDGWLPLTALECGFNVTVVTEYEKHRQQFARWLQNTLAVDFLTLNITGQVDVVSLCGTLERVNFPPLFLERAASILKDDGIMLLSFANAASVAWQVADGQNTHREWNNPFRQHFYSFERLRTLLEERNMAVVQYDVLSGSCADALIVAKKRKV